VTSVTAALDPARSRRRLGRDARREQLVAVGLAMVKDTPVDQVSAEVVAEAAGVSKALVFHYFASTRDLQVAIVRAATQELLAQLDVDPSMAPDARLRAGLEAFITYIEQQPASYTAMSRGAGSDPQLQAVFEETRNEVVRLIAGALGLPAPTVGLRIMLRGWIAMVEETVLHWLEDEAVPRDQLVAFLHGMATSMLLLPESVTIAATTDGVERHVS
jgi:AcrR family transcriptional regulator